MKPSADGGPRSTVYGLRATIAALALAFVSLAPTVATGGDHYALVITGVSAGPKYAANYDQWRTRLVTVLEGKFGFDRSHVVVLTEHPGAGQALASADQVRRALTGLRAAMKQDDLLLVVLIGHGTFDGEAAKFNLVGPDLDADQWAELVGAWPGRLVFVDTTSSSLPFLRKLAGRNRIVITATDAATQRFETVFPEFFVKALEEAAADADKDGRLSVWEIFAAASLSVRRWYEQRGQLPTERALLDDLGDAIGKDADAPGVDKREAARVFLDAPTPAAARNDTGASSLAARRASLLAEVSRLKMRKAAMPEEEYARQLEDVLVELARVSRQTRK